MKNQVKRFIKDEKGQGMTEYGLILGGIAVVAVAAVGLIGTNLNTKLSEIAGKILKP
jgi:pilus assembly protein Flp/PilA